MSDNENTEAFERGMAAWNAGDFEAMAREYRPDARVLAPAGWPESQNAEGWDQISRQFARLKDSWSEDATEVVEIKSSGDRLFVKLRWRTTGNASGIVTETTTFTAVELEGGLVKRQSFYWDRDEALAAAGMEDG